MSLYVHCNHPRFNSSSVTWICTMPSLIISLLPLMSSLPHWFISRISLSTSLLFSEPLLVVALHHTQRRSQGHDNGLCSSHNLLWPSSSFPPPALSILLTLLQSHFFPCSSSITPGLLHLGAFPHAVPYAWSSLTDMVCSFIFFMSTSQWPTASPLLNCNTAL